MHHNSTIEAAAIAPIAFAVERADILPALDILKRRIIARGTSAILAGVKIEAMPGCVKLTATDCDIMLSIDIPAHVETPGACVLDCENLRKLVNKSDKRAEIRLSIADGYATVTSARARNRLPTVQLDGFPARIASIGETQNTFALSADMVRALDYVAPFASTEDATRGYICGVAFQSDGTTATMIGTAGHVLSFAEFDAPDGMGEHAVLPNKAIAAIQALTKGKSAPLSVETTKEGAVIGGDNWTLTTKQVDGNFPAWRNVLPVGEMEGLLMPELAPNLNPGHVESFKKTIPGPLSWELGAAGCGDAWVARIKSADVPNWTGLLCTTREQVAPNGYNFEGETVEVDGKEYPVATSSRGIHLTAETVRALCGTPEELAAMQARHDALTKARKVLAYPVFKGDATADCYRSPAYLAHLVACQRVTDQRRAFELAAARGCDADDCLSAAWDATATPIEAIAPATPIAEIEAPAPVSEELNVQEKTYSRGAKSRAERAIAMLNGDKPGLGRRALDDCFEMGDGDQVAAIIRDKLEANIDFARRLYFGIRKYRAAYPGDYPETHYARDHFPIDWLAIVIQHGIIRLDHISNQYGTQDKVAALLSGSEPTPPEPTQGAQEPIPATITHEAPATPPVDDLTGDTAALSVQDNPNGNGFVVCDGAGDVLAGPFWTVWQAESAKAELAPPSVEIAELPTVSVESKPKRTPAHERAIRLAWAQHTARRLAETRNRNGVRQLADMREDRDGFKELFESAARRDVDRYHENAALTEKRRRAVLLAWEIRKGRSISRDNAAERLLRIVDLSAELQAERSEGKNALRKSRDDAQSIAATERRKRANSVLLARDLQKRLSGEYRLIDKLTGQKRDAFRQLATEKEARLQAENALAAITARANGWPPAVRSVNVNFAKAA